jgi:hypothetical protein
MGILMHSAVKNTAHISKFALPTAIYSVNQLKEK